MPKFRIVTEETTTELRAKVFEAASLEAAQEQAEADDWRTWELWDEPSTNAEIREDQCGRIDGVYCDYCGAGPEDETPHEADCPLR